MAKTQKKISNNLVIVLVGIAVIAFGAVTLVAAYSESIVNNFYGQSNVDQSSGGMLGAAPSDIASGFWDVYVENDMSIDGSLTLNGTTTPAVNTYYSITESLDLTGTSTAKGASQNIVAYYWNTGSDKIVDYVAIDLTTQLGLWTASFQCSTSTWVSNLEGFSLSGTTTAGIIASSTVAATYDTGDAGIFVLDNRTKPGASYKINDMGAASSTAFLLKHNEVLFCTWTPFGATSSDSFTAGGGFTGAGNMIAEVRARGN